ncbi:MAG: WYL domain-containing protein [Candidatus Uhrbacteria bacterium]
MPQRYVVFDVETQREFAEVGGAQNRHLLGIAVIGAYDSATDAFLTFLERDVLAFGKLLRTADLIIGFNSKHFDYAVIQPYLPFEAAKLPTLDLMADLERILGHRIGLDACATATLGAGKSGDGLQAIRWFREGRIDLVQKYCLDDVRITRDLYRYGVEHGEIYFTGKDGSRRAVPVMWGGGVVDPADVRAAATRAFRSGRRVEIEYVSTNAADGTHHRNRRKIDIIAIHDDAIDAYCHLRNDTRHFSFDRIVDIRVLDEVAESRLAIGQRSLL